MDTLELVLIASLCCYFLAMIWASTSALKPSASADFAIANRDLGVLSITSSLAASFRDGAGIVTWVGFGFTIGYGGMWVMLGSLAALCLYTAFSARIRMSASEQDAITVGELIRTALGPLTEKLSATLVLIFSLVIIAVQLYVAGNLCAEIIGFDHRLGMAVVAIVVGIYLGLGGYSAVIKTDVIQFILILAVVLIPMTIIDNNPSLQDLSSVFSFPAVDQLALFLLGFFYVMSSSDIWQKLFAARNQSVVRRSFPLSGLVLIFMTLSLIWLGMSMQGLVSDDIESGRIIFEVFKQQVLSTPLLALLLIVIVSITMSTLDTFCYLFSSSLAKNFQVGGPGRERYVLVTRLTMLLALAFGMILAISINDVIQAIFEAASLLFILSPLYISLGFGWLRRSQRLDRLTSLSILVSVGVYLVMLLRGDFADMIMLMVPVLVNAALLTAIIGGTRSTRRQGQH